MSDTCNIATFVWETDSDFSSVVRDMVSSFPFMSSALSNSSEQKLLDEPLSRRPYVLICFLLPGAFIFTAIMGKAILVLPAPVKQLPFAKWLLTCCSSCGSSSSWVLSPDCCIWCRNVVCFLPHSGTLHLLSDLQILAE